MSKNWERFALIHWAVDLKPSSSSGHIDWEPCMWMHGPTASASSASYLSPSNLHVVNVSIGVSVFLLLVCVWQLQWSPIKVPPSGQPKCDCNRDDTMSGKSPQGIGTKEYGAICGLTLYQGDTTCELDYITAASDYGKHLGPWCNGVTSIGSCILFIFMNPVQNEMV